MIRALLLIFEPVATWERIFRSQRTPALVLLFDLAPMLVVSGLAEGFGLLRWGRHFSELDKVRYFSPGEVVWFEGALAVVYLMIVLGTAQLLASACDTFHGRQHKYRQALATTVYGMSPVFLFRILDALPGLSPWVPWSVGVLLSLGVLYYGVPRMMEPDPPHAFGLFLIHALVLVLATGLLRYVTIGYLQGKFGRFPAPAGA